MYCPLLAYFVFVLHFVNVNSLSSFSLREEMIFAHCSISSLLGSFFNFSQLYNLIRQKYVLDKEKRKREKEAISTLMSKLTKRCWYVSWFQV